METLFADARSAAEPGIADRSMPVLVAEDNPMFLSILRSMLCEWGYRAVLARDGLAAWQILQTENPPQLAILDWMMPVLDGVQLCRRVRAAAREPYTYILLLSARSEAPDLVEGMEAGADDYVTKPFQPHELRVRLRAGRRILDLQEQLLMAREALRVQATHDGLTCLFNHAAILEALQNEVARAGRERQPLSVLLVDLDEFKRVNDTYGHPVGDAVLCEAAARMKAAVRGYDAVGRYGGEEFLIVLPGCDSAAACARAESLRQALAREPFHTGGLPFRVTCSVGIACTEDFPGDSLVLVREADRALYRSKVGGRDRVERAWAEDSKGLIR
jgi:two-component system, cell cycle response regulator